MIYVILDSTQENKLVIINHAGYSDFFFDMKELTNSVALKINK